MAATGTSGVAAAGGDTSKSANGKKDNSPESAGAVRGLTRSAVHHGVRRVAVGRLPIPAPHASASAAAGKLKNLHKAAHKIKEVAEISEKVHKGVEYYENYKASSSGLNTKNTPPMQYWGTRALKFTGGLAKHGILGAAVFSTYEGIVGQCKENNNNHYYDDHDSTTLFQHFGAGFAAGSVHAVLGRFMSGLTAVPTKQLSVGKMASSLSSNFGPSFLPYFLQHAASHAVLFGSFEATKRLGLRVVEYENSKTAADIDTILDERLVAVGFAGCVAGIGQQFVADSVKLLTTPGSTFKPPRYSPKALFMMAVPTGIGFVAFEYAREAVKEGKEEH
mmetsp:Transcript_26837/g.59135  ORF Transcript_26837/g.59135 Transcript_26837/m.59135 type:complete len:334 (-) Transcript_26837:308-1309(-)|eukprot:CAMPEP_0201138612 /NCGR_PEP_ID=MMETSP0850-20130426/56017_1 /ASSEMBLY_ACC=CAM_ASM_000622 /TAXON_ID=183588 /ORGANISM="Pseudo-nitzschia fraudulenta, Strain WWA7" /LENGTH=333 /DNA_ID=CAMNT_0047410007 /DNA_START=67 /DNA_END=1068 /DNA_ORIENTATION=-